MIDMKKLFIILALLVGLQSCMEVQIGKLKVNCMMNGWNKATLTDLLLV